MNDILRDLDTAKEFDDFKDAFFLHDDAYRFIKEHKIWRGFMSYGWVSKIMMIFGILISLSLVSILIHWFEHVFGDGDGIIESTATMVGEFKDMFLGGSIKYMIVALTAILIFHCSVKTINILDGRNKMPQFQDFVNAQKRMIAVVIRSFIFESIIGGIFFIFLKIFGMESLKYIPMFFVHSYFIGFAFFDSYNEQYGFSLKESQDQVKNKLGSVLAIGMIAVLLLKLPLIGAIVAPILCSTAATMYLYGEGVHWPQLPRIFHEDKLRLKPLKEKSKLKS